MNTAEEMALEFGRFLEEQTKVIYEEKITLYRYHDSDGWGNYILDDIFTVFKEKYEPASQSVATPEAEIDWDKLKERFYEDCTLADDHCIEFSFKYDGDPEKVFEWFKAAIKEKRDDYEPSKIQSPDETSLASHTCTEGNSIEQRLKPAHKCEPLAMAAMGEGREWWVGKLTERIEEWPVETHCLHLKTPLKDVVFLCNSGDFSQLTVLCAVALGYKADPTWIDSQIEMAKERMEQSLLNTNHQQL